MEEFMETHVKCSSTQAGATVPPFFFPKAKPLGPDIVLYIRVNGNMFPVFVQLKLHPILSDNNTDNALETGSERKMLKRVETLGGYCPTNWTNVSMVITYPSRVVTSQIPRPNQILVNESLNQVVVKINRSNFGKIFPQSHVDLIVEINEDDDQEEQEEQQAPEYIVLYCTM